jgi:hypothetical protein
MAWRSGRWRADRKELYYRGLDGGVMAIDTQTDPTFQAATSCVVSGAAHFLKCLAFHQRQLH